MRRPDGGGSRARIGFPTATAIVVGNMIGTGVFTSLGFQVGDLPSGFVLMVLWMLGGVVSMCGALSYARLASVLPRSGGEYHFLGELFHPMAGFLAGWVSITVAFAAPVALSAMALAAYLERVVPMLSPRVVAVVAVLGPALVHLWRIEAGSRMQLVFTVLKVLLVVVLAVAGLAVGGAVDFGFFLPAAGDAGLLVRPGFAVSLVFVMYAYSGWNAATYMIDEIREPRRTVPAALLVGTLVVTVLYVSVNAAFVRSAPLAALQGELEVGLVAAWHLFGDRGANIVAVMVGLGLLASISAMLWAGSRVVERVGQDFRSLRFLSRTTRRGVPVIAVLAQSLIAVGLLLTSTFEPVLVATQIVLLLSSFATVAGVFFLPRRRVGGGGEGRSGGEVPLWGYPVTPLIFLAVTGWMIVYTVLAEPWPSLAGVGILGLGAFVYGVLGGRNRSAGRDPDDAIDAGLL